MDHQTGGGGGVEGNDVGKATLRLTREPDTKGGLGAKTLRSGEREV